MPSELSPGGPLASPDEMLATLILLNDRGYGDGEVSDDEESQEFAADVRRLNPDWQPGEIPKVPERAGVDPEGAAAPLEELIRLRGDWAYWPDGTVKAVWLLVMGAEAWEAKQRQMRRKMLEERARLQRLRRQGYWFDQEHRLRAPARVVERPARVQAAARAPRRRSGRTSTANARAPGSSSDDDPPHLEAVPLTRFRRDVDAWLEAVGR